MKEHWTTLISYGIGTGEFKIADPQRIVDVILYAARGMRMWEKFIRIDETAVNHIIDTIRELLHMEEA